MSDRVKVSPAVVAVPGRVAPAPEHPALRMYVDTSVFARCEDEEFVFKEAPRRLVEGFRTGELKLILSALTVDELDGAPETAMRLLSTVPKEHTEFLKPSAEAEELADRYIEAGAADAKTRPAALHVALATLAAVDTLTTWDNRHIASYNRERSYNPVNRELGHPRLEIHEPRSVLGEQIRDPDAKGFDCVAFQREQRYRISRKLNAMTSEERVDWLRNVEVTDPILRRFMERARADGLCPSLPTVRRPNAHPSRPDERRAGSSDGATGPPDRGRTSTASPSSGSNGNDSAGSSTA